MAEQVDAADLKSVGSNPVPVRFRPSAPIKREALCLFFYWYVCIGTKRHGAGLNRSEQADIRRRLPLGKRARSALKNF